MESAVARNTKVKDPTINTENRAPTVGEEEVIHVKKRNYPHVFDRAPFVGTIEVDLLDCFKRRKIHPVTKKL